MSQTDQPICKICGKEASSYLSKGRANGSAPIRDYYCGECIKDIYKPEDKE